MTLPSAQEPVPGPAQSSDAPASVHHRAQAASRTAPPSRDTPGSLSDSASPAATVAVGAGNAHQARWAALGLTHPVVNAPMAGAAGGDMATAVRRSGGLGLVAVGHGATAEAIDRELRLAAEAARGDARTALGARPPGAWGVGLMAWSLALDNNAALHRALDFAPPVIALAAGDPTEPAAVASQAGAVVAVQVGTAAEVRAALADPHIDVVVVRGAEGGGHGLNKAATLPLLQYALECSQQAASGSAGHKHAGDVLPTDGAKPVLAAGGIATVQGVAAVLTAGAAGAWVGTRFLPCAESLFAPRLRDAIAAAGLDDTVYTSVFDLALGLPWPREYGGRALNNAVAAQWAPKQEELRSALAAHDEEARCLSARVRAARAAGDASAAPVYAGQSAGLVPQQSVGQTVASVMDELGAVAPLLRAAADRWS